MNKLFTKLLTFVIIALTLTSCDYSDQASRPGKGRVILVYMAANNNLSSDAVNNIEAMKLGYIPPKDDANLLLVYRHSAGQAPALIRLTKDKFGEPIEELVVQYEEQNSADPVVFNAVLEKVKLLFPKDDYGLILWSHATGWLPSGYYSGRNSVRGDANHTQEIDPYAHLVKSFGADDDGRSEIEITDLAKAIPFHCSFILFDCCLMSGIESAYELKDVCDYFAAAPTEILANGFPYNLIMEPLFEKRADLVAACEKYYDFYNSQTGYSRSATIAVIESRRLEAVAKIAKEVFAKNRDKIEDIDRYKVQPYFRMNKHWFYDIADFVKNIASEDDYDTFCDKMDNAIIYKASTPSFLGVIINPDSFSGVSTYIQSPKNIRLDTFYKKFKWNMDTEMVL